MNKEQVLGLVRHILTFVGGILVAKGLATEENAIVLGDKNGPEGITTWTKSQFKDFVEAAKNGKFDKVVEETN